MFTRISPDHPLTRAAREVNDLADTNGLQGTIDVIGMNVSVEAMFYLGEQRAIRAVAALDGYNMGHDPERDEQVAREVVESDRWKQLRLVLISAYADGFAIGYRAAQIA